MSVSEQEQTRQFLQFMQDEHPDWTNLSQHFQLSLDDESLAEEFPNFDQYAQFVGGEIIMRFIRERGNIPSLQKMYDLQHATKAWPEYWERSGLHDEVISDMVGRVLKHYGLYEPLPLEYFMLQHFVQRLDMDTTLDLAVQRNRVRALVEEIFPTQMLSLIDYLADNNTEMHHRADCLNKGEEEELFYFSNCDFFFTPAILSPEDFRRRIEFMEDDKRGRMLRIFSFIYWFDNEYKGFRTEEFSNMIISVFADARMSREYQAFKSDREAFSEGLYQQYLLERSNY